MLSKLSGRTAMPLLRPASRLANAAASFVFILSTARSLNAEEVSDWAVIGALVGTLTVLSGYPLRLGIFQFFQRYKAAKASEAFAGHLLFLQLLTVSLSVLVLIGAKVPSGDVAQAIVAGAALAGRVVFELVIELLRAARTSRKDRTLVLMYSLRSAALCAGAGVAVARGTSFTAVEAFAVLAISFYVPLAYGLSAENVQPMFNGLLSRRARRHITSYLRYTVFLTIPYLLDSATLSIERAAYAVLVAPGRVAEYFVWADLSRYYLNLVAVLYAFEVLPELLARSRTLSVAEQRDRRAFLASRSKLLVAAVVGGIAVALTTHFAAPRVVLGQKQPYANFAEFISIIAGVLLWMLRTQILAIHFQMRRTVYVHSVLAIICVVMFIVVMYVFYLFGSVERHFYFFVPLANALSIMLYIVYAAVKSAR